MNADEFRDYILGELEGIECWSARELQDLLGYSKWENFEKVIQKAKDACKNAGEEVDYHFPDVRKTIHRETSIPPAMLIPSLHKLLYHFHYLR